MNLERLLDKAVASLNEPEAPQGRSILEMRMSEFAVSGLVQEVKSGGAG